MEGADALGRHATTRSSRNAGRCVAVQLLPARLPARRQAGRCTSPTCRGRSPPGRGCAPASRRAGSAFEGERGRRRCDGRRRASHGAPARRAAAPGSSVRGAPAWRGPRRRRLRHARAAAALRRSLAQRAARAQPQDPPRLLGRRALRRGGARLGRRDAELRGRRVAGPRASCSRRRSPRSRSAASGCPGTGAEHQERIASYDHIASTGVHLSDRSTRAGRASPATARCGSPTGSPATTPPGSPSGSPARPSSSTPPARREVYPQIAGHPDDPARPDRRPRRLAPGARGACAWRRSIRWARRGWTRDPEPRRRRHRRRRPRRRGPLRRRRQPVPELDRRQPDDDDHRDGLTGRARAGRRST